jgi:hypothetical protein
MMSQKDPKGLAFYAKIAEMVCSEYDFKHEWTRQNDVYILDVQCGSNRLAFHIERRTLDDPGSEEYREIAEKLLARLLEAFRAKTTASGRADAQHSSAPRH